MNVCAWRGLRGAGPTAAGGGTVSTARGFTLIELIIFIVIVSIMGVALISAFSASTRGAPEAGLMTQATQIAQERMELVMAQRRAVSFAAFADPCPGPGPAACTPPAGYTVVVVIAPNWNGDANYKQVTVTVSGLGSATATSIVANY